MSSWELIICIAHRYVKVKGAFGRAKKIGQNRNWVKERVRKSKSNFRMFIFKCLLDSWVKCEWRWRGRVIIKSMRRVDFPRLVSTDRSSSTWLYFCAHTWRPVKKEGSDREKLFSSMIVIFRVFQYTRFRHREPSREHFSRRHAFFPSLFSSANYIFIISPSLVGFASITSRNVLLRISRETKNRDRRQKTVFRRRKYIYAAKGVN